MDTILYALYKVLDLVVFLIFIRSIMTWFPNGRESKFYSILSTLTEPIEGPIRNIMYKYTNGPVDFSPLIAILVIMLLKRVILLMIL